MKLHNCLEAAYLFFYETIANSWRTYMLSSCVPGSSAAPSFDTMQFGSLEARKASWESWTRMKNLCHSARLRRALAHLRLPSNASLRLQASLKPTRHLERRALPHRPPAAPATGSPCVDDSRRAPSEMLGMPRMPGFLPGH